MVQPLWKTVWEFLTKLNIPLLYDPAIIVLGIYLKELKTYVKTKTCTWMLVTTYLIIAKTWRQTRGPLVDEWEKKLWYIQTMEYYSVLKSYQAVKRHGATLNTFS